MKQLLGGPLTGGPHGLRSPPRSGSHPRLRTNDSGTSATTRPAGGHGTNHPCRVWAPRRHHTDRARLHGQRQPAANASSITPRFPTTPRGSITERARFRESPDVADVNEACDSGRPRDSRGISVGSHRGRSVESFPPSLPMLGDSRPPHEATSRDSPTRNPWASSGDGGALGAELDPHRHAVA